MKIALDVEGVLADPHSLVMEKSDLLTDENFDDWSWDNDEIRGEFYRISQKIWKNHYDDVGMVDPYAPFAVQSIALEHDLDVVTGRTGVDENLKTWLNHQNIFYNDFISTDDKKSKLDYDLYIDDNPRMIGEVNYLFLYHNQWNNHYQTGDSTHRVHSFKDIEDKINRVNFK